MQRELYSDMLKMTAKSRRFLLWLFTIALFVLSLAISPSYAFADEYDSGLSQDVTAPEAVQEDASIADETAPGDVQEDASITVAQADQEESTEDEATEGGEPLPDPVPDQKEAIEPEASNVAEELPEASDTGSASTEEMLADNASSGMNSSSSSNVQLSENTDQESKSYNAEPVGKTVEQLVSETNAAHDSGKHQDSANDEGDSAQMLESAGRKGNSGSKAVDVASAVASKVLNSQSEEGTVEINFVVDGILYIEDDSEYVQDDASSVLLTTDEIFVKADIDGNELEHFVLLKKALGDGSNSLSTSTYSIYGKTRNVVKANMALSQCLPTAYRMGYTFTGWHFYIEDDDEDLSNRLFLGSMTDTLEDVLESNVDDYEDITSFVLVASWMYDLSNYLYINIQKDTTTGEGEEDVTDYEEIGWDDAVTLPDITESLDDYSYPTSGNLGTYEFVGYVLDSPDYWTDSDDIEEGGPDFSCYIAAESDWAGAIPVISPGTYTYGDLYYRVFGNSAGGAMTFPTNRYYADNEYLPNELSYPEGAKTSGKLFKPELFLRAVFKEKTLEKIEYQVKYYNTNRDNGGSTQVGNPVEYSDPSKDKAKTAADLGITAPVSKDGDDGYAFTFKGWTYEPEAKNPKLIAEGGSLATVNNGSAPEDGKTYSLYAVWTKTAKTYTVIYNPNGGSGSTVTETHEIPSAGTEAVESATALGYTKGTDTFAGWYNGGETAPASGTSANVTAGGKLSTLSPSEGDTIHLWAIWTPTTYTVNYHANDADNKSVISNPYSESVPTGSGAVTISAPAVTRTGYTFTGWAQGSASGTVVADKDNKLTSAFQSSIKAGETYELYATWKEVEYTVKWWAQWDSNGAVTANYAEQTSKIKYETDGTSTLSGYAPASTFIKVGDHYTASGTTYQFVGWYLTKGPTGTWSTPAKGNVAVGTYNLQDAIKLSGATTTADTLTIFGIWKTVAGYTYEYYDDNVGGANKIWSNTVYEGDTHTVISNVPTKQGYHFDHWYTVPTTINFLAGEPIKVGELKGGMSTAQALVFIPHWVANDVNVTLLPGASDGSIKLNAKTGIKTVVGGTISGSDLVTTTPERNGYDFAGWVLSSSTGVVSDSTVVVNSAASPEKKYTVPTSAAPTNPGSLYLAATWTPTKYTVRYNANKISSDTRNQVRFTKSGSTVMAPYTYTTSAEYTDSGFDAPDITATYGSQFQSSWASWYTFQGWGTASSDTVGVSSTDQFKDLYAVQNRTDKVLDLYALWAPIIFTVAYESADTTLGTVAAATNTGSLTVSLATASDSDVLAYTATPVATGYTQATPTWKDTAGKNAPGVSTSAKQATYAPSIDALRQLYVQDGSTSVTYRAFFTTAEFAYQVEAYLQKADGSWNDVADNRWTTRNILGNKLEAAYGTTVNYDDTLVSGSYSGRYLWEAPLLALKDGGATATGTIENINLYDLVNTKGTLSIAITNTPANNVLKFYYGRKTYDLVSEFVNKPVGVTTSSSSYLNGGSATTALRWGQSVPVTSPSTTGYTFAWSVTEPSGATSASPASPSGTFALNAQDMYKLVQTGSTQAKLTGTFTVETYTITLNDTDSNSTRDWVTATGTAGSALKNTGTASMSVAYDGTLDNWVPSTNDQAYDAVKQTGYKYYFAGWRLTSDTSAAPAIISSDTLKGMSNWSGPVSYTAVWLEKVVITYDPGDSDSAGNSKAAWSAKSISLTGVTSTNVLGDGTDGTKPGTFAVLVNSFDDKNRPKGADGWKFAYWTYVGDQNIDNRYGHIAAYSGNAHFMNGTTNADGFTLSQSYTFVAHWVGLTQPVTIDDSNTVANNTANASTVKGDLPKTVDTYVTDQVLNLSDYKLDNVPNGYAQIGWTDGSKTYTLTDTLHVPYGGVNLKPLFNEDTVTFTYLVSTASSGKGTISGTASDTVFAVTHDGITDHTATVNNTPAGAYAFVDWKYGSTQVAVNPGTTLAFASDADNNMGIKAGDILTDRTYYADFKTNTYTVTFDTDGTDGATIMGSVLAGAGNNTANGYEVEWNTTIPASGAVNIVTPDGYELDGWLVNGSTTPTTFGTNATVANGQGIMSYKVTGNVILTAHFKMKTAKEYKVNYEFDPGNKSKYTPTSGTSRLVAWGDSVLPTGNDKAPKQAGFTFDGWFIDSAYTTAVSGSTTTATSTITDMFGTIYTKLKNDGASNVDTSAQAITIYAKWTPKHYEVVFDTYGNVPDDTTTNDDNTTPASFANATVNWGDQAQQFKKGQTDLARGGYVLDGWRATVVDSVSGLTETAARVADADTFGKLANNNDANTTITLHAIWKSLKYNVQYKYNDPTKKPEDDTVVTVSRGWADEHDYYPDPNGTVPSIDGYKFEGWKVQYYSNSTYVDGSNITGHGNTSIKTIANGDVAATSGNPVVILTGIWKKQSTYVFQDVLVHRDGSTENRDFTQAKSIEGNTSIDFSAYGYNSGKTSYSGYDFDNHTQQLATWAATTPHSITVAAGVDGVFYVYYIERAYTVQYFKEAGDATSSDATSNNPWESAPVSLPSAAPTKDGYTFDGWYVTDGTTEKKLTGSNSLADVLSVAPNAGALITAVGKWTEKTATISWTSDANGTLNPAAGSVTRQATSNDAIGAITPAPATDYVFEKWTYSYTDENGTTYNGDVTSALPFATLTDQDGDNVYETLQPIKWAMSGSAPVWNSITFTAHFAPSDTQPVTYQVFLENGNKLGEFVQQPDITVRDAEDKVLYTVSSAAGALHPAPVFAGYTFNSGIAGSDVSHVYDMDVASTHVFKLYYNANPHQVSYEYVEGDGTTSQTPPAGATPLGALNGGTYYTGQQLTVENAPSLTGYTFSGWFLSTDYGNTNISGTKFDVKDSDITIVGTWSLLQRKVDFIVDSTSVEYAAGSRVTQPTGGFLVTDGQLVSSVKPAATTLADLGVTYVGGTGYTLSGWDVLINGAKQGATLGINDPLSYRVTSDVTFRAVWSETYTVTYTRGRHGVFKDTTGTNNSVVWPHIAENAALNPADSTKNYGYNGTVDNATTNSENRGNPQAAAGWMFVGWGTFDNLTKSWTYYFDYDAAIDYGVPVDSTTYQKSSVPTQVKNNIDFVGFYKAMQRTLVFQMTKYDGTSAGTAYTPPASPKSGVNTNVSATTGSTPTLLAAADVNRPGYDLIGWTDGSSTYTPGSTGEFSMPEVAAGTQVYLYPVFKLQELEINYAVASGQGSWGGVDRVKDYQNASTTVQGSTPQAKPGYKFDYWTKDSDTTPLGASDGFDSVTGKLTPKESGTYYAHFGRKEYSFAYDADPTYVSEVTQPATALPTNAVWTDSVTLDPATRAGYDFDGWDVYESSDWTTNKTSAKKLHSAVKSASALVSDLSSSDGNATSLVLVPTFVKKVLGVTYHLTDGSWSWSGTASDYPAGDPMLTDSTADPTAKIQHVIDDTVNLRLAPTVTRAGYVLVGWQDAENNPVNSYPFSAHTSFTMGAVDVDLYPMWQAKEVYQVTFVSKPAADGGAAAVSNMPTDVPQSPATLKWDDKVYVQVYDSTTSAYSAPARKGYTFQGWTVYASDYGTDPSTATVVGTTGSTPLAGTDYDFSALALTDTSATQHLYLVANWLEQSSYNVKFVGRPATDTSTDAVSGLHADYVNIKYSASDIDLTAPTRKGYTFAGWQSDVAAVPNPSAATNVLYSALVNDDDTITVVTLTATWTVKNAYKVTFDNNAGSETVNNMPASPQDNLKWSDTVNTRAGSVNADPSRAGYKFAGWTVYNKAGDVLGNTDKTPYTGLTDSYAPAFSALAFNDDDPNNEELKLVAQWTPKVYKVVFAPGTSDSSVTGMPADRDNLSYSADDIDGSAPSRTGYTFAYWVSDVLPSGSNHVSAGTGLAYATLVNSDDDLAVTLTAHWTADVHTLTYVKGSDDTWSTVGSDYPTEPAGNGATDPGKAIVSATDETITLRTGAAITRAGSQLIGWANGTDDSAAGYREYKFADTSTLTMPAEDVILYPLWKELGNYNVVFQPGDAIGATKVNTTTMPSSLTGITYGKEDIDAHAPTRAGYSFAGWQDDALPSGSNVVSAGTSLKYADLVNNNSGIYTVTLAALWTPNLVYYVTYNDGVPAGSIAYSGSTVPVPASRSGISFDEADVKRTALADADRPGFKFTGWKVTNTTASHAGNGSVLDTVTSGFGTDALYSALVGGDATITNITFTAMWEGSSYHVKYILADGSWITTNITTDGGASSPNAPLEYKTEQTVPLRLANTVSRPGYELLGWQTAENGGTPYKFATTTAFQMPGNDVDLYPIWDAKKYNVSFQTGDASGVTKVNLSTMPGNKTGIKYDDSVGHAAPTRDGYAFGGWDISRDDTGVVIGTAGDGSSPYSALANDDTISAITLTAVWTPNTTSITYSLVYTAADWNAKNIKDGGASAPNNKVSYSMDTTVVLRQADTAKRAGYVLLGWKDSNEDGVVPNTYLFADNTDKLVMPSHDVYLYAIWDKAADYAVKFDKNEPTNAAPGATAGNVPYDQPQAGNTLTWDGSTGVVYISVPTFPGYTFKYWVVKDSLGNVVTDKDGKAITNNGVSDYFNHLAGNVDSPEHKTLTLVAEWGEPDKKYNVYFVDRRSDDASPSDPVNGMPNDQTGITYTDTVNHTAPTRAGYTFDGWAVEDVTTGGYESLIDILSPSSAQQAYYAYTGTPNNPNITSLRFTAMWTAKSTYAVVFESNAGADTVDRMPDNVTGATWNQKIVTLKDTLNPKRKGYSFKGWTIYNAATLRVVLGGSDSAPYTGAEYAFAALAQNNDVAESQTLTLVANWGPKTYSVTYKANDASGATKVTSATMPADVTGLKFTDLVDVHEPTRAGYDFVEWQSNIVAVPAVSGSSTKVAYTTLVNADDDEDSVVLTAIWKARMAYNVNYENGVNGTTNYPFVGTLPLSRAGIAYDADDVKQTELNAAGAIDRVGYKFTGWVVTNTTLGHASEGAELATVTSYADAVYSAIAKDETITSITYTAQWEPVQYKVKYHIDGFADAGWMSVNIADAGAATPDAPVEYDVETSVDLRLANTVARAGHVLAGWASGTDNTAAGYHEYLFATPEVNFNMPAADVDLYPLWTEKAYKVFFDGNAPSTIAALGNVTVPANQPVAPAVLHWTSKVDASAASFTGYTFVGWTVKDMNGNVVGTTAGSQAPLAGGEYAFNKLANDDDSDANAELTLVANWELAHIYKVVFADGVEAVADVTPITAGTLPVTQDGLTFVSSVDDHAPSRVGYVFNGWTVEDVTDGEDNPRALADVAAFDAGTALYYVLAGNDAAAVTLKLTAKWTPNTIYNVHFVANDNAARPANMGGLVDLLNIGWDTKFQGGPAPTRSGYTFTHWAVTNTTDPASVKSIGRANAEVDGKAVYYVYHDLAYNASTKKQDAGITDITLTAMWEPAKHTVKYVISGYDGASWNADAIADKGAAAPNDPMNYAVDETVELRDSDTVTRAGYVLSGWQDGEIAPANVYLFASAKSFYMGDSDVELFPVWTPKTYTVVFHEGEFTVYNAVLQKVAGMPTNPQTGLNWTSSVDTTNPTLAGYIFAGWLIQDAAQTGANTATLMDGAYDFDELALTDTAEHETLNLVAQWVAAPYRVTYVDLTDANGATAAAPMVIATDANMQWVDEVSDADPWALSESYNVKSADNWQFTGWQLLGADGSFIPVSSAADLVYRTLAAYEDLTVADTATSGAEPALTLYAGWTRRVPFIVDYVKLPQTAGGTADAGQKVIDLPSTTLVGLDGDDIASVWANEVLNLGDARTILGYTYNRSASAPGMVGTLSASQLGDGNELHLVLYYDQLLDYQVVYVGFDGEGGYVKADLPVKTTRTVAAAPAWDTSDANFAPTDSDWFYRGHELAYWTYGPTGKEFRFSATDGKTFADIAAAIYGNVDGSEGRSADKPVELHAVWTERKDYTVSYDDNYLTGRENNNIVDRFLERVPDVENPYTPDDTEGVEYSSSNILPDVEGDIVEPGVKDANLALYDLVGWNYSATADGNNQKPAEGKTYQEIVEDIANTLGDPTYDPDEIKLYARWQEKSMELKYTPVLVALDENGKYVEVTGGQGGGTVSRSSETILAVTGTADATGSKMLAQGATVTVSPGYHFVGWRRVSDGETIYVSTWDPAVLAMSAQSLADGNVLPSTVTGADMLFQVAQNEADGYWHEEEYEALFAQNDIAILHYDKNAEDADGSIEDVDGPYGSLIDLSDGKPFTRTYWTLVNWNTEADGSGTSYNLGEKGWELPEGETTLYAQWKRNNATLTYSSGNGEGVTGLPEALTDEWGGTYTISDKVPVRKHYTFVGWNTKPDGTGTAYRAGDEYVLPGAGETLYAQWEANWYPVDLGDTDATYPGGKVTRSLISNDDVITGADGAYSVEYGGHLPKGALTATPDEGYHLTGWKYTMVDEDGTVTTGVVSDPSELEVTGSVTFDPIFEADAVEDESSDASSRTKGAAQSTKGGVLPATGDTALAVVAAAAVAVAALALLLLVVAMRRRRSDA